MKSTKKRGSRSKCKRRCTTRKRSKGGMHRAARAASKFASQVFGKGPERLNKLNQMKDAILKGAAKNEGALRTTSSARSQQFAVDDSPRLRIDPGMHMMDLHDNNDTYYTTPKKSSENKTEVPILASRTRPEETLETRGTRLASFVAPTSHHPDPIVKTLFPE